MIVKTDGSFAALPGSRRWAWRSAERGASPHGPARCRAPCPGVSGVNNKSDVFRCKNLLDQTWKPCSIVAMALSHFKNL